MNLLSLFATIVFAAKAVISPLPNTITLKQQNVLMPLKTFGSLRSPPPVPTKPPPPPTYQTRKRHYTIALLGDSMIDTLGPDAPLVNSQLISRFPNTTFTILNYGVGATNIDYGIKRLTNSYTYLGRDIPPLVSTQPDVVVVESFAYNPYSSSDGALKRHWNALATIVDTLKSDIPGVKIVIAATIAPNSFVFGNGAPGISLNFFEKIEQTATIKQYLENAIRFAQNKHLPLADVYHASLDILGNGRLQYINSSDHIHYSQEGQVLFAQTLVDTILANHLFGETLLAINPI